MIDLIGYRRHGHSEVDDPTITQPLLYKAIKEHPPLWEIYGGRSGIDATIARRRCGRDLRRRTEVRPTPSVRKKPLLRVAAGILGAFQRRRYKSQYEVDTAMSADELLQLSASGLPRYPADFHIHPKVKKLLEQRAEMGAGKRPVDYGMAEALAFAPW